MLIPRVNKLSPEKKSRVYSSAPTPAATLVNNQPSPSAYQQVNLSSQTNNFQSFNYPNSKVTNLDNHTLILESQDNPTIITNWYKKQIQGQGMKTTSFVETDTNGEVFNQLVGTNGTERIRVSISKNATSQLVKIELNI